MLCSHHCHGISSIYPLSGVSLPLTPHFPPFFCLPQKIPSLCLTKSHFPPVRAGHLPTPRTWDGGGEHLWSHTFLRAPSKDGSLPEHPVSFVHVFLYLITSTFLYFLIEKEIKVKEIILSGTQVQKKVRQSSDLSSIKIAAHGNVLFFFCIKLNINF